MTAPRYERLDVIAEGGHSRRRWQVIAVETDHYLVHSLFGAAEPSFNRWPHDAAEAKTSLEHRHPAEEIGEICVCGCASLLPGTCRWCGRLASPVNEGETR